MFSTLRFCSLFSIRRQVRDHSALLIWVLLSQSFTQSTYPSEIGFFPVRVLWGDEFAPPGCGRPPEAVAGKLGSGAAGAPAAGLPDAVPEAAVPEGGCPDELVLGAGVGSDREGGKTLRGAPEVGGEIVAPGAVGLGVADGAVLGAAAPGDAPPPEVAPPVCANAWPVKKHKARP
jgi:hypothetical protein